MNLTRTLDRTLYPVTPDYWNAYLYRGQVFSLLPRTGRLLDLGAGRGREPLLHFPKSCELVCGCDPDEDVLLNPHLDDARVMRGPKFAIPYDGASFDVVCCANVVEHLIDVDFFFSEVARVLKPGGSFVLMTPNKWNYVAMIARWTPHWFHCAINSLRGVQHFDVFPTTYKCNTRGRIDAACRRAGLELSSFAIHENRPEYLRMTPPTYLAGWLYEKLVNSCQALERFRNVIVAAAHKPDGLRRKEVKRHAHVLSGGAGVHPVDVDVNHVPGLNVVV